MAQRVAAAQGRMNRRFLIVAGLLAALSFALVYAKISAKGGAGSGSSGGGDLQVVVARVAVPANTRIVPDMLQVKSVPLSAKSDGALTRVDDVVGRVTKLPLVVNQQVTTTSIIETTRPTADASLKNFVPAGRRAMSIQASQVISAGGLILPGDWVDVVWTCCKDNAVAAKTILKNVQVAAVAQTFVNSGIVAGSTPVAGAPTPSSNNPIATDPAKPDPGAVTATLLLTPDESQTLFLAESFGKLRLDLRGAGDQDLADTQVTLVTQLLPVDALAALPESLKPDGYKR